MSYNASRIIRLPGVPKEAEPWLKNLEKSLGKIFHFSKGEWSLNFDESDENCKISKMVCPSEPIALNGNLDFVVNEICSILCSKLETRYDRILSGYPHHITRSQLLSAVYGRDPEIFEYRFGAVMELHHTGMKLFTEKSDKVKKLFKESILPLMMEKYGMTYVTPVRLNIDYLRAINHLAQIHFTMSKMVFAKAEEFIRHDKAQKGFEMRHGIFFHNLLIMLTRFGEMNITYPLRRGTYTWHFFKDEDCREPFESRVGTSNVLLASDNPRLDVSFSSSTKTYDILVEASKHSHFAKQCVYGSIYGVNKLMDYFCNLKNFVNADDALDSKKFLQAISTMRLMQADFQGITISQEPNTQLVLALEFLDKLANLTNGIAGGKSNDEGTIFKNWVKRNRPQIVKGILEKRFTKMHQTFGSALTRSMSQCYKDIRSSLSKRSYGGKNYGEIESRFRDLRNINHGAFLREEKGAKNKYTDKFERLYFEGGEELPREISMLPYYLLWGFIFSPKEFVEKMSSTE